MQSKKLGFLSLSTPAMARATVTVLAALASGPAQAVPVLSELYYDAVGSDDGESFVEIYGSPGTSLADFVIDGINGSNGAVGPTILLEGRIGASGLFVVADRRADGTSSVLGADLLANFDFQNGPDSIVLRQGATVFDSLGYGTFVAGEINAGEGASAPAVSAGSSLARLYADIDTNDNAADFIALATPTPGSAPISAVPEPGSALLIGLGLSGLASVSRPRVATGDRLRTAAR
jgi:hypothetical protein